MRFYNVATAASITGFVRAFLMKSIQATQNPLYCDTDSIVCENASKLLIGDKLGEWKSEGTGNLGAIAGKKLYAFNIGKEWKIASKGCKLTKDQIFAIARGESITYEPIAPTFSIKSEPRFIDRLIRAT